MKTIDIKEGARLLHTRSKAFRDRYFKAYGSMAIRISDSSYMMTRHTLPLSGIRESDVNLYDINSGCMYRSFSKIFIKGRYYAAGP